MSFLFAALLFVQSGSPLAWRMNCKQYWAAVRRVDENPFYQKKENQAARRYVLRVFKSKTPSICHGLLTSNDTFKF